MVVVMVLCIDILRAWTQERSVWLGVVSVWTRRRAEAACVDIRRDENRNEVGKRALLLQRSEQAQTRQANARICVVGEEAER